MSEKHPADEKQDLIRFLINFEEQHLIWRRSWTGLFQKLDHEMVEKYLETHGFKRGRILEPGVVLYRRKDRIIQIPENKEFSDYQIRLIEIMEESAKENLGWVD